jgi:thiol peroxidase
MAQVLQRGKPVNTNGELPAVGKKAPEFRLVDSQLQDVGLDAFKGKKKVLNIVPSLDTAVCAASARKFNDLAKGREDVVVITISADLPFAQKRFCSVENIENVKTLSMMRDKNFARDYGVLITEGPAEGLSARSVVVLDENDIVRYTELVREQSNEPDYDAAIAALD